MRIGNVIGAFILIAGAQAVAAGQTSFWTNSAVPRTPEASDTASVNVGLKFYSDVPGSVTGLRFYKGPDNKGTHVGNLWSSTGTKLASVTFSGETASGWQLAAFSSPVNIAANTTYVISYLAPQGYYADDQSYAWKTLTAMPLHVSGSSPGVYAYGSAAAFPTGTWNTTNYWVDPVFVAQATIPASGATTAGSTMFWTNSTVPGTPEVTSDKASVTLGLRFYADCLLYTSPSPRDTR